MRQRAPGSRRHAQSRDKVRRSGGSKRRELAALGSQKQRRKTVETNLTGETILPVAGVACWRLPIGRDGVRPTISGIDRSSGAGEMFVQAETARRQSLKGQRQNEQQATDGTPSHSPTAPNVRETTLAARHAGNNVGFSRR